MLVREAAVCCDSPVSGTNMFNFRTATIVYVFVPPTRPRPRRQLDFIKLYFSRFTRQTLGHVTQLLA